MGVNIWVDGLGPAGPEKSHPKWAAAARVEQEAIFASGHFKKTPKLGRLLTYLVEQTLDGKGDKLKSYTVGIDALGRAPDFDPNIDSYPRVQVLRLRNMLESYYARHEPVADLCLFIPPGSYAVRLGRRPIAYPALINQRAATGAEISAMYSEGASSETIKSAAAPTVPQTLQPALPIVPPKADGLLNLKSKSALQMWFLIIVVLIGLAAAYLFFRQETPPPFAATGRSMSESPVLLIEKPTSSKNAASQALSEQAYAELADGIGRSWAVRLILENENEAKDDAGLVQYRLAIQAGDSRDGSGPLYLRLIDSRSDQLIWSSNTRMDPARAVSDNLGRSIVQLAGPFGIISTRETRQAGAVFYPGYSCLLAYIDYLKSQDVSLRPRLSNCLEQPAGNDRLDAVRLALLSFHILETAQPADRRSAMAQALSIAQRAIRLNPKEAYAHFAMARIFFVSDNCSMGILHTRHAAEANPYDPVLLAVLGNFASQCGEPYGDELLARAFELRSPGESYARLSLILAAIRNGRTDQLPSLSAEADNARGVNIAYHFLCETLIAAASGDIPKSRIQWQSFVAASVSPEGTPEEMMRPVVLSRQVRVRIIGFLKTKAVIPPE